MGAEQNHFGHFLKSHLFLLVLAAAVLILLIFWPQAVVSKKSLGKCLTEKGVIMYGADSCENCANQKKLFGEDFINVNYINCEFYYEECQKKGISVYPLWALNNRVLAGAQTLPVLSKFAGCADKV